MTPNNTGRRVNRVSNQRNVVRLIGTMVRHDCSLKELAERTGMDYETIRPVIKLMHADGSVHISHWRIDTMGRQSIAVYKLGLGTDAPKRKAKTQLQRTREWQNRNLVKLQTSNSVMVKNGALDALMRTWKNTEVSLA